MLSVTEMNETIKSSKCDNEIEHGCVENFLQSAAITGAKQCNTLQFFGSF